MLPVIREVMSPNPSFPIGARRRALVAPVVALALVFAGSGGVYHTHGRHGRVPPTTTSSTVTTTTRPATTTTATSARSTTTTAHATTTTQPHSATYLFDDEFNGSGVDGSKWQPNWLGASAGAITPPVNGAEVTCYDPAQVTEPGDGYLHLTAAHRSCRAANGVIYPYASGLVNTFSHFRFTYGRVEARIWLPGSSSITNWPAFWTDGAGTWPLTGEDDVVEGLAGKACYHFHSPLGGPGGCAVGTFTGWHTYAAEWRSGRVTYSYDGHVVGTITSGVTSAPMYLILNLGIGSYGGTMGAPSQMLVDWVHVTP